MSPILGILPMVLVRNAQEKDTGAVAALHKGEGWCYDEEVVLNDYWDDDFDKESIIVAEVDDKVVGTIELGRAHKARFGFFGVIRRFVVHPDYRERNIGRALMNYAIEEAKRIGCKAVELSVDPGNSRAHKYYLSLGFNDDRTEIIMVKESI
jgi:GNAT superfamily N-acetyltransferase